MKSLISIAMYFLLLFTNDASAAENKTYHCKVFESSANIVSATILFGKSFLGGISGARVNLLKSPSTRNSTIQFRGPIKTPEQNSYDQSIYLETQNKCEVWPICDMYFLRFKGYAHNVDYSELPTEIDFVFESVTGPATNRRSDISLLICSRN